MNTSTKAQQRAPPFLNDEPPERGVHRFLTTWMSAQASSNMLLGVPQLDKWGDAGIRQVTHVRLEVLMLALFGAFGQEIAGLRRQMVIEEVINSRGCRLYRGVLKGKDCLLVQTGMGKQRAEDATRSVLEGYSVAAIVSLGFAGALNPELKIGELVVCSRMHGASGPEEGQARTYDADANLLALASRQPGDRTPRFRLGSGVTVMQLDSSPQLMEELHHRFHADIVDMESYWIAGIASARHVPFIAIRSISDTMKQSVQPFDRILTSDGRLLWRKAALSFLFHPRYLANVFTLFRNTRLAEKNLTAFISHLVAAI